MRSDEPFDTGPVDEHDTPAEVDAAFRTLRRVAFGHVAVFAGVVTIVPLLAAALGWWSQGRLFGGMSPMFAMTAFGLYVFFFVVCLAAATLSNAVEERMLGGPGREAHHEDGAAPP
ncbi:hypothetical protein [Allosalinactinospora lopnorensis]|uniref:hypothetical protein n=1 Tax=Allosalinactinospora lopnorensis TaxID=1352348 RepID=UPI000623BC74|nr:hypothetical protein [Allosalinactinospora lopnorensis]